MLASRGLTAIQDRRQIAHRQRPGAQRAHDLRARRLTHDFSDRLEQRGGGSGQKRLAPEADARRGKTGARRLLEGHILFRQNLPAPGLRGCPGVASRNASSVPIRYSPSPLTPAMRAATTSMVAARRKRHIDSATGWPME